MSQEGVMERERVIENNRGVLPGLVSSTLGIFVGYCIVHISENL